MIQKSRFFKLSCAVFLILLPISCAEENSNTTDCGDSATLTATPATPGLGGYPTLTLTNKSSLTLFGTKSRNTSVVIKNGGTTAAVADYDCLTTWAADVSLNEGANPLEIFALNRTGAAGSSNTISITRDTAAPAAPAVDPFTSPTSTSPFTLSGSKAAGEAVFINNRLVVEASVSTSWSYDVTLATGANTFSVQLQDPAGNKSAITTVSVTFSIAASTPPNLFSPLGNAGVVDTTPLFEWDGTGGGTFCLQVSTSINFTNEDKNCNGSLDSGEDTNTNSTLDVPTVHISTTLSSFAPSTSLSPGRYYWRVGRVSGSNVFYSPSREVIIGESLCDLNDDGFHDMIVGAYENDAAGTNAGKVYVYYGGSSFNNTVDVVLTGEQPGDRFGISTACAGDVNNDGVSDLIVGAYQNDGGGTNAGRAYIFYGGSTLASKGAGDADIKLTGQAADDQFGLSVSTAGDVNGDGYDDVIVGAYQNDGGGTNAGRAYLYYGGSAMDTLPDVVFTGEAARDQFGIRVAWAGDVNGDTYDDVIVGADRVDVGSLIDAGRAYLFFGASNMTGRNASAADVILSGEGDDDAFASVAGAGDFNNDGYSDIVVGASAHKIPTGGETNCFNNIDDDGDGNTDRNDTDCQPVGRTYLFLGGSGLTSESATGADLSLDGETAGDAFGFAVAHAGDIDGDGYSDLLVGAFGKDGSSGGKTVLDMGKAYLFYGNATLTGGAGVTMTGQAALACSLPNTSLGACPDANKLPLSGQFGFALGGAGDVNGDGNQDIVIGSYLWDDGVISVDPVGRVSFSGTDKGQAYLFLGPLTSSSYTAETQASFIFTGDAGSDGFGVSVQ